MGSPATAESSNNDRQQSARMSCILRKLWYLKAKNSCSAQRTKPCQIQPRMGAVCNHSHHLLSWPQSLCVLFRRCPPECRQGLLVATPKGWSRPIAERGQDESGARQAATTRRRGNDEPDLDLCVSSSAMIFMARSLLCIWRCENDHVYYRETVL